MPDIVAAVGMDALRLACDLLETALVLSHRRRDGDEHDPEDYSADWRPAIEDSSQNQPRLYPVKNSLVSAVRNAAEQLAQVDIACVPALIECLEQRPWYIFQRMALHLLRRFPHAPMAPVLIAERLTDHRRFEARSLRYEYVLLGRDYFAHLSCDEQATILRWIAGGPDLDNLMRMAQECFGAPPTDAELDRYTRTWRRDRLGWFHAALPSAWQQQYEELVTDLGAPEHPEFVSYLTGGSFAPTSPQRVEDFQTMRVEEIVAFLDTWQSSGDLLAPSPEGLGRVLTGVVASAPEGFATKAHCFQALDPTYVRALLAGFYEAVKQHQVFPWAPVIALCRWVIQQPRESLQPERTVFIRDAGWDWTRKTITDLLSDGFASGPAEIPPDLRGAVWGV